MNPQGTNNPYPYPHYPNPNPNSNPNPSPTFASAPPFSHYPSYPPDPSPVPQPYSPHPNPPSFPSDPYLPPAPIYPHDPERPDLSAPRFDYAPERPDLAAGRFDYPAGRPDYGGAGRSDYGTGRSDYGGIRSDYGAGRSDYGAGRSDYGAGRSDYGAGRHDYGGTPERVNSRLEQEFGGGYGRVEDVFGDGVYAYNGGRVEPYGSRGTKVSGSSAPAFDDYGRSMSFSGSQKESGGGLGKVVKAVPKVEVDEDAKSGVSKFRVKLLAESAGQTTMDVVCQIGFNGILMLEPNTKRTLRIYPLGTITKWEINSGDPSICQFWSKSPVDIEPRRIRLQSNRYTASTILDVIAASTVQFKEMGGTEESGIGKGTSGSSEPSGESAEKKKGFIDWMNIIKPPIEEKDHWVPDTVVSKCTSCGADFGAFLRRHHCRNCGDIFCDKCTTGRTALTGDDQAPIVRVCDRCMAEVTRRLEISKEVANKPVGLRTHGDLAKRLQEELEKKCKVSSGKKSSNGSSSGRRMREVACPTCTVHLQVQVPSSGSETIECGVCQHPFLVSSR